jgi:hypothetical protein
MPTGARSLTSPLVDMHRERIGEMLKTNTATTVQQRRARRVR